MEQIFRYIRTYLSSIGILILNICYFIPKTIEWLSWQSGVTMGYVAIELIFNYCIHVFFICSCFSLTNKKNKRFKVFLFVGIAVLFSTSFLFAFRIMEFAIVAIVFGYCFLFYWIFMQLQNNSSLTMRFKLVNRIGFFITLLWLFSDILLFR